MSWARWDHFQFPERKQKDLVTTLTPGEHLCLAWLWPKSSQRNWARCPVSFFLTMGRPNIRVLHPNTMFQPVLVPCSVGHPRTGFGTNLKIFYTNLGLCYPKEHLSFYQTQLFQQQLSDVTRLRGPKGQEKKTPQWEESRRGHSMCPGKVMVFLRKLLLKDFSPGRPANTTTIQMTISTNINVLSTTKSAEKPVSSWTLFPQTLRKHFHLSTGREHFGFVLHHLQCCKHSAKRPWWETVRNCDG